MSGIQISMLQVFEVEQVHANAKIKAYAQSLEDILIKWRGLGHADLAEMPATVERYLDHAPKFSKSKKRLLRELIWSVDTYKQYQRRGRLAIEDDGWARLTDVLEQLADAGLLPRQALASLARICDAGRAAGLEPSALSNDAVTALLEEVPAGSRDGLIRGARLLDRVRQYPDAAALLPADEIGAIDRQGRGSGSRRICRRIWQHGSRPRQQPRPKAGQAMRCAKSSPSAIQPVCGASTGPRSGTMSTRSANCARSGVMRGSRIFFSEIDVYGVVCA